jgi:hypothetical protein
MNYYIHTEIPELSSAFLDKGNVSLGPGPKAVELGAMEVALSAMDLALRLGIPSPSKSGPEDLPYAAQSGTLLFDAPLLTAVVNKKLMYLRGWNEFDSCVKGFNSLGLMADHVLREFKRIKALPLPQQNQLKLEFLKTRALDGERVFTAKGLEDINESEFLELDDRDVAVWHCFAQRTIVCSTSSNMGISSHQALRLMQKVKLKFRGKEFCLLNKNEGSLIIWCPDKRADFMNEEKTIYLENLENDLPRITTLRTYINRQQRDPGALKDALLAGGYFFPTNPQSKDEMQNLIFVALNDIAKECDVGLAELFKDDKIRWTLGSLNCEIQRDKVVVGAGIESGISGLMLSYVIMLEQFLQHELGSAVSVWNQASIGAALAGMVLADKLLREQQNLRDDIRSSLNSFFPSISEFLDTHRLGRDLKTRIHGVFDIANLQSLAQLLGSVVEHHLTGRNTAYVGLGSSSYSNGNRCFDILKESIDHNGAFSGRKAFHPATHTLNPFAQALIFGEDLYRFLLRHHSSGSLDSKAVSETMDQVKKTEPAGAAALAGYLLARLDMGTLSIFEIAYGLRLMGFSQKLFLQFAGYQPNDQGLRKFLQSAFEEGPRMEHLAQSLLLLLDWSLIELEKTMAIEKKQSRARYWQEPLDDLDFERLNGPTCINLTGDNTGQPSQPFFTALARACLKNRAATEKFLAQSSASLSTNHSSAPASLASLLLHRGAKLANAIGDRMEKIEKQMELDRLK